MKRYNLVIVYENGTSRSTTANTESKQDAIAHALGTDWNSEDILTITIVEYKREDI